MKNKKQIWKRNCPNPDRNPNCKKVISYSGIYERDKAEKRNTNCRSCATKGKNNPMYGKFGEDNSNFGSKRSEETRKNISESKKGIKRSEKTRKNISESRRGQVPWNNGLTKYDDPRLKRSDESKKKSRLSMLKNIEKNNGQVSPNYNKIGCEMINLFNMYYGFNFQHAENGGEKCIGGYFPDGLDEERKTIIEIDEPRHYDTNGKLKEKDIQRQGYLEGLGYEFIRIKI